MSDLPLFSSQTPSPESGEVSPFQVKPTTGLSAAIAAWGKVLEAEGRSIHTVKAFTADMRLVAKFTGGGVSIQSIGTHDLKNFLDWMLNKRGVSCSPKTYARRVTSIKSFFRWLVQAGVLEENPATAVPQQSVISPLPTVLSGEEMNAVLDAANRMRNNDHPDPRPYTLVALLLHTAIKKGECLNIHLNHIDLHSPDGPILFIRYGNVRKRYKERKIPLPESWIPAYREYLQQYSPANKLFPWSPRRLEYLLEDIGEEAGLEKHLSFDMCRWSAALSSYRDGMDHDRLRQLLGISKIQWREVGKKLARLAEKES